jgi:hypothetical protein
MILKTSRICPICKGKFKKVGRPNQVLCNKCVGDPECHKEYLRQYGERYKAKHPSGSYFKSEPPDKPKETIHNHYTLQRLSPEKLEKAIRNMGR